MFVDPDMPKDQNEIFILNVNDWNCKTIIDTLLIAFELIEYPYFYLIRECYL